MASKNPNMYVVECTDGGVRISMPIEEEHDAQSNTKNKKRKTTAPDDDAIPETVLQYERQMRKIQAADRAGSSVTADEHLRVIHDDEHIVVTDKPSGVLSVPGVNHNPSLLTVVYEQYGCESGVMDSMAVHRLDMDTSGLVTFAKTDFALRAMHEIFRERRVCKSYEALLCGHLPFDEGIINLPLQRDHRHPPFMRVSTPKSNEAAAQAVEDLRNNGWKKIKMKKPKQSQTEFQVVSRETYGEDLPVTRVKYTPITGRTHQLRVHSAAIGHPIVADPTYGIYGEAHANGGFDEADMSVMLSPNRASISLQKDINKVVQEEGKCMCLHAKELSFVHPVTNKDMKFVAPTPF